MTDLDEALRADAHRWRAAQQLELNLDAMVDDVALTSHQPRQSQPQQSRRRLFTALGAAAAVLVAAGGVALLANRFDARTPPHPVVRGSHVVPASPASTGSTGPAGPNELGGLGGPPTGQRTLFRSTGRSDLVSDVAPATGRGEVYAVCVGGGTIAVELPGHGGFDVDCTGTPAGASLPTLGRTVRISHVTGQRWRIAVYGR